MMKTDHSTANDLVATLAVRRNVTLPARVGEVQQRDIEDLSKKSGVDFDRAYIKAMIRAHDQTIDLFEQAADKVKDSEIKIFIDNTLPKLRNHLDSAKAIQKIIK